MDRTHGQNNRVLRKCYTGITTGFSFLVTFKDNNEIQQYSG